MKKNLKSIFYTIIASIAFLTSISIEARGGFGAGFGWGFLGGALLTSNATYGYYPNYYSTGYYPSFTYGYNPYGYYGYYPYGSYGSYGYPGNYFYW